MTYHITLVTQTDAQQFSFAHYQLTIVASFCCDKIIIIHRRELCRSTTHMNIHDPSFSLPSSIIMVFIPVTPCPTVSHTSIQRHVILSKYHTANIAKTDSTFLVTIYYIRTRDFCSYQLSRFSKYSLCISFFCKSFQQCNITCLIFTNESLSSLIYQRHKPENDPINGQYMAQMNTKLCAPPH